MQTISKKIIFGLLLVVLSLPLLQRVTHLFNERCVLNGAFVKPDKPKFSLDSLSTSDFQKQTENYENYNFGFRAFLIKLKNSIDYFLYKDISVSDQLEGKNGYIYSWGSIEGTITGNRYNGKEKNDATISGITLVKNEIEKKGGHFLVVFAPSKESVYPENIPARYNGAIRKHSDHEELAEGFKKNNVPFLDFTPYFQMLHKKSSDPLFTKTGFHWSVFGAAIAQDSLISYIQHIYGEPMVTYERKGIEQSDTARFPDADFEGPMNLLFSLQDRLYIYPKLELVPSTLSRRRPKVIVIGDSFFSNIKELGQLKYVFSADSKFWYYFKNSTLMGDDNETQMKDVDVVTDLESADFVILFGSLSTLNNFPYGITDYYYKNDLLFGMIGQIEEYLKRDTLLLSKIKKEAAAKNVSIESRIASEAKLIFSKGQKINLETPDHKYVCADAAKNDLLFANRESAYAWETFTLLPLGNEKYVMYSFKNKFLTTELSKKTEITATREAIGAWEIFSIIRLDSNMVALKGVNGKYIGVDNASAGQLFARSNTIGRQEMFKMIVQ
jgi:hypothetical protein